MGNINDRLKAFKHAFNGLTAAIQTESHLKIHFLILLVVLNLGFYFNLNAYEWMAVIFCSAMVIALELINSALEALCDLVMPNENNKIKYIKNVAAASVLVSAIASIIIGYLVFWPHIVFKWLT